MLASRWKGWASGVGHSVESDGPRSRPAATAEAASISSAWVRWVGSGVAESGGLAESDGVAEAGMVKASESASTDAGDSARGTASAKASSQPTVPG